MENDKLLQYTVLLLRLINFIICDFCFSLFLFSTFSTLIFLFCSMLAIFFSFQILLSSCLSFFLFTSLLISSYLSDVITEGICSIDCFRFCLVVCFSRIYSHEKINLR